MGRTSWDTWHFSWNVGFRQTHTAQVKGKIHRGGVGGQHWAVRVRKGQSRRGAWKAGWSPAADGPECQVAETRFILRKEGGKRPLFCSRQSCLAAGRMDLRGEPGAEGVVILCLFDNTGSLLITQLCGWTEHRSDPFLKLGHSLHDSWVRLKDF